jgi:hypothetical protein
MMEWSEDSERNDAEDEAFFAPWAEAMVKAEEHTEHYSAEDLMTTKKELELARFQLKAVTDRMLPALQAILQETVPV